MHSLLIIIIAIPVFGFVLLVLLSVVCRFKTKSGLIDNQLSPCPGTPNCVCSEYQQDAGCTDPILLQIDPQSAMAQAVKIITDMGGIVQTRHPAYCWACFTTKLFRFIDDFEIRIDVENQLMHIRSASRVGYSDMGVNAKRVSQFKQLFREINIKTS